ncbi:MAG TPA: ATP-binding protein [Anaerolineae bacterium]|nr:ATP-binding protein [Anaerolineae bacterium]
MMGHKDWPPLLRLLGEELGYTVHASGRTLGYDLFNVDLSSWKLRLSDTTPVIWVRRSDLEATTPQHLFESLTDVLRERSLTRQIVIVLLDGDSTTLLKLATNPIYSLVILGSDDQARVVDSRRPSGELLDLIAAQVSISSLAPYETRAPVTGSRFFGREYEISRVIGNPDTNHALLGIRRIGKTSLLREVERLLKEGHDPAQVIYLECSDLLGTEDYVREVVRKLNPRELPRLHMQKYVFFFPDFLERMARANKTKLVFLLDEIDNLVLAQRGDWELFRMLRASANKGACQYILAGFREAMREQYLLDSPFYNFAQEIRLNEFTRRQAHDLIVVPMENLRVRIRNKDDVVGRIYEETAGQPNLIQYYCMILLRRLDRTGEREISPESLIDVYSDEGFKSHLLTSFMQNTENREKALIYAVLMASDGPQARGFSHSFIDAALRKRGIVLPQGDIDEACSVLTLAGVVYRRGKEYFFASPVFTKVLQGTYDLEYLLRKAKEEGV